VGDVTDVSGLASPRHFAACNGTSALAVFFLALA
jgi:hypothetical protein